MELNILRIDVDRSHRVFSTNNLSLNQCSNNNQIRLYYEGDYDFIQMSFRKPDGWLSDKVTLIFDIDEEGYKYAYYDVDEEFTSFIMGGRNGILQANLYFNIRLNATEYQTATTGNIRINVNYVDDALVNTNFSQAYMNNVNATVGALQNDFNDFKTGDIQVGSAIMDSQDNVIHTHYETKSDARQKYDALDSKKLDRSEVQDQTQRLQAVETNISTTNANVNTLKTDLSNTKNTVDLNKSDIEILKNTTVSDTEFNEAIETRKQVEINLQSQIDSIQQSSVFKDMVDTVSKLSSYDKSKLVEGDRILVLSDSIIYRWNGTDFERVGKYGSATYTKAEIDSQHNNITNTIPNKGTLNDGKLVLSKGNIPISTTDVKLKTVNNESIWGEGNIVIPVDTEFSQTSTNPVENRLITNAILQKADETKVQELSRKLENKADRTELEAKQNKLTAGNNITIDDSGRISVNGLISLQLIPEGESLEDYKPGLTNIIYIYKPDNETGYSEYLWIEEKQDFEPFGEAGIHLENYYTIKQIEELLARKANLEFVNNIDARVSQNTADIATKADRKTTNNTIGNLSASLVNLQSAVATKADKTVVDTLPTRSEFSDLTATVNSKQDLLRSGENIKKIRTAEGVQDILGSGELLITNATITDLGLYYTKEELDPKLATKADKSEIIKDYTLLENKPDLDVYRRIEDSYSKTEVDDAIAAADISDRLTNYYTKTEVDNAIEDLDISNKLTEYATKTEVEEAVAAVDVSEQLKDYATKVDVANTYITQANATASFATKGELEQLNVKLPEKTSQLINDSGYITKLDIPKDLGEFTNNPGYLTAESNSFKKKQDKLLSGTNIKTINGQDILGAGDLKVITDVSKLETKADAENKLAEAKDYTDRTNITTLASAKSYTDNTIRDLTEDTEGALEAIKEIKDQIGGEGVNILSSINQNKLDITVLRSDLSTEITNRTNGDTTLDGKITTLNTKVDNNIKRIDDDLISLNNKLNAEEAARIAEDTNIYSVIETFTGQTDTKITNINDTVSSLDTRVTSAQKDISDHKIAADTKFSELDSKVGMKILFKNWTV